MGRTEMPRYVLSSQSPFQGETGIVKMSLKRQEEERSCVIRPNSFKWQWRAIDRLYAERLQKKKRRRKVRSFLLQCEDKL